MGQAWSNGQWAGPNYFNPVQTSDAHTWTRTFSFRLTDLFRNDFRSCWVNQKNFCGLLEYFYALATRHCWRKHCVLGLSVDHVCLSEQILLVQYLSECLEHDKDDGKYSLAPTDDRIRFWGSKVTAGCRGGERIRIDTEVYLLVSG